MQPLLEHFGVAVGAITGALAARGKRVDLFGVLVLALVTAFGGGTSNSGSPSRPRIPARRRTSVMSGPATRDTGFT